MNGALFVSLVGFAFVSSITPGPNNLLLMSSGALFGWRRSLPHLGGVLLGFAVVMASAVFGLGELVDTWPWLLTAVPAELFGHHWFEGIDFLETRWQPREIETEATDQLLGTGLRSE